MRLSENELKAVAFDRALRKNRAGQYWLIGLVIVWILFLVLSLFVDTGTCKVCVIDAITNVGAIVVFGTFAIVFIKAHRKGRSLFVEIKKEYQDENIPR